jgi:AcrR family transcriptional regulator
MKSPAGLRERKKSQTRTTILQAGIDLFERNGYDATTIEQIAEAANVSPRTVFRYFETKAALLLSADEGAASLLQDRPPSEPPFQAFHQALRTQIEGLVEDPLAMRRLLIMLRTPSLRVTTREVLEAHRDKFEDDFARRLGLDPGDLMARVTAGAALATAYAVISTWAEHGAEPKRLLLLLDDGFRLLEEALHSAVRSLPTNAQR